VVRWLGSDCPVVKVNRKTATIRLPERLRLGRETMAVPWDDLVFVMTAAQAAEAARAVDGGAA
jgi:hypothetical protein